MPVNKLISLVKPELEQVNAIILDAAKSEIDLIPKIADHLINAGGKRLRPIFTLASAKLSGHEGERHVNLAVAVEFMHTATLLHDDVVDESEKRRGRDTANNIWGNKASVLVGDYLLGRSFQMMTADGSIPVLKILSDAAARIAEGEVMQLTTTQNIATTEAEYIEVVQAKTAELFAAACEVGGAIVADLEKQKNLRAFGENFGIAFQIVDDILDYAAEPEKFGKNVGDDLREGKMTIPLIKALAKSRETEKSFLVGLIQGEIELSTESLEAASAIIRSCGALDESYAQAKEYAAKARAALEQFEKSPLRDAMLDVLDYSIEREF